MTMPIVEPHVPLGAPRAESRSLQGMVTGARPWTIVTVGIGIGIGA